MSTATTTALVTGASSGIGEATWLSVDLTDADAPERVRAHVAGRHGGRLTLLVDNAGAAWRGAFAEQGYANLRRHMELNLDAVAAAESRN